MPDRDPLLDELADAWQTWDPMPADLPDRILTAVAMRDLDADFEVLTLLSRSDSLLGARSDPDDRTLIEFQAHGFSVLVRIVESTPGRHRLDGWCTPASLVSVRYGQDGRETPARVVSASRFEADDVTPGLTHLVVEVSDDRGVRHFRSPHFEI